MARRLAAILAYDAVGYSAAIGRDESGTLRSLKDDRSTFYDPEAKLNGGRTIKLTGDGALMEFASVVDAVLFAVRVQSAIAQRNAEEFTDHGLEYRIGINLGDVVTEGDDIYGDGVNVAARLEGLAPPGGICIRRRVRSELQGKLDLDFEDLGEVAVKNIDEPIRAFNVILNEKAQALADAPVEGRDQTRRRSRLVPLAAGAAVVALIVVALGVLQPWQGSDEQTMDQDAVAAVSDGASIAVLPFTNISDDADQEYFADGITEDLITDLSKVPDLLVIARNSMFTYKGKAVKVPEVAAELGVKYVMEGSVRRVGDRVRINAQLINGADGTHVWAERYDRALTDIFAVQDEITGEIVGNLHLELAPEKATEAKLVETASFKAYDLFLRAMDQHLADYSKDSWKKIITLLEQAIEIDPNYSRAHAWLALFYFELKQEEWSSTLGISDETVEEKIKFHVEMAEKNPAAILYYLRSKMLVREKKFEESIKESMKLIELEPNNVIGLEGLARSYNKAGYYQKGLEISQRMEQIDPLAVQPGWFWRQGESFFHTGQFDKAVEKFETYAAHEPNYEWTYHWLAAAYGQAGRIEDAKKALARFEELRSALGHEPYTVAKMDEWSIRYDRDRERIKEGLRNAGMPEG